MSNYGNMLKNLDADKSIAWTKFYKFSAVLEIEPWVALV